MQCAVYDTYVRKKDGNVMHFDVVVEAKTPHEKAYRIWKEVFRKRRRRGTTDDSRGMPILSYPTSTSEDRD